MKRIFGVMGIGLLLIIATWMPAVISEHEINDERIKFYAFGFIRIDSNKYEINGFVLVGMNGNHMLTFERIQIKYDGIPIFVANPMPLLFIITYNPAE